MSRTWNLQDAKAKLSELVDRAERGEPQVILRRGSPAAAVISLQDYQRLQPRKTLVSFLLDSPHVGLDIPRSDEPFEPRSDLFGDDE